MKATLIIKPGGGVILETIKGVAGPACTKAAKELEGLMQGKVIKDSFKKTNQYHEKTAEKEIQVGR